MNLTMKMYEYSKDIHISIRSYINYKDIQFICKPENYTQFIQYNTDKKISETEIKKLAIDEYTSGNFPCEGIVIDCIRKDIECDMIYNPIKNNIDKLQEDIINIVNLPYDIQQKQNKCYWVDINKLFLSNITCPSLCFVEDDKLFNNSNGIPVYSVILIIVISFCIIFLLGVIIIKYHGNVYKNGKNAIIVQNPMIIVLAIGLYFDEP
eukprot:134603_1